MNDEPTGKQGVWDVRVRKAVAAERAAVVAWLRRVGLERGDFAVGEWGLAADAIERGEHHDSPARVPPGTAGRDTRR